VPRSPKGTAAGSCAATWREIRNGRVLGPKRPRETEKSGGPAESFTFPVTTTESPPYPCVSSKGEEKKRGGKGGIESDHKWKKGARLEGTIHQLARNGREKKPLDHVI